jgi:parvulin-like peptidyl-prolyl isomerase
MHRSTVFGLALAGALALGSLAACEKTPQQPPEGPATKKRQPAKHKGPPKLSPEERKVVLAEVNGKTITKGEFHDRIHRQSVFNRRRYTKIERKKKYLEREFIMPVLEYAEAKKRGLRKDPYVQRTLKNLMVSKLMRKLRSEFKTDEPSEPELKAFYKKHRDDYNQPELVRVSHILVKTKAEADKLLAEAKGKSRVQFRRLVQKHSLDEATKNRAGDLRYFDEKGNVRGMASASLGKVPQPIVKAVWEIKKPGTVVGPVKTGKGFHVIYFTGRRPARKRTYAQARLHVKKRVMREKWQAKKKAFIDKLKKKFQVELPAKDVLEKRLGLVKVDLTAPSPRRGHHRRRRGRMIPHRGHHGRRGR